MTTEEPYILNDLLLIKEFAAQHEDTKSGGGMILFTSGHHLLTDTLGLSLAVAVTANLAERESSVLGSSPPS